MRILQLGIIIGTPALFMAGCDWALDQMMGGGEYSVVLIDEPTTLERGSMHLVPKVPLEVRGVTTDLCLGLADNVSLDSDLDARLEQTLGGAKISATLHVDDGRDYTWMCNGWQLGAGSPSGEGRLSVCMRWECNGGPPKGSAVTSIDLRSDRPLRVLDVRWSSTAAFDHVSNPPKDPFISESAEYRDLADHFGGKAAWSVKAKPALQVSMTSSRRDRSHSEFSSTLVVRLGEDGLQIAPVDADAGLGVITIPTGSVDACSMSSFGPLAKNSELILVEPGVLLGFLNAPEVVDWCWQHKIPMISHSARSEWLYKRAELPPRTDFSEQLQSRAAYVEQARRSAMGF